MFSHSCSWISRKVFKKGGGGNAALTSAAKFFNRSFFGSCAVRGWTLLSIFARGHSTLLLPHWVCWIRFLRRNVQRNKVYCHFFDWTNKEQSFFICSCNSLGNINQDGFFGGVYFLCTKTSACNWSYQCSLFQPRIEPNFWNYPQFASAMYKINLKEMNIL